MVTSQSLTKSESEGGCQTPTFGSEADEEPSLSFGFESAFSLRPPPEIYGTPPDNNLQHHPPAYTHLPTPLPAAPRPPVNPSFPPPLHSPLPQWHYADIPPKPMQHQEPRSHPADLLAQLTPPGQRPSHETPIPTPRTPPDCRHTDQRVPSKQDLHTPQSLRPPYQSAHSDTQPPSQRLNTTATPSASKESPQSPFTSQDSAGGLTGDVAVSFAATDQGQWTSPSDTMHSVPHFQSPLPSGKTSEPTATPATCAVASDFNDASPQSAKVNRPAVNPCPLSAFNAVLIPSDGWAEIRYPLWPTALMEAKTRAPDTEGPDGSLYGMFAQSELEVQTLSSYWHYLRQEEQAHYLRMLRGSPFMFDDTKDGIQAEQKGYFVARFLRRSLYCVEDALERILSTCEWLSMFAFRALDRLRVERLIESGALYFHGYDRELRPVLVVRMARLDWMSTDQVELLVARVCFFFGQYLVVLGKVEQMTVLVDTHLLSRGVDSQRTCKQNFEHLLKMLSDHFPYLANRIVATASVIPALEGGACPQIMVVPKQVLPRIIDTHQLEQSLGGLRPDAQTFTLPTIYNPDLQAGKFRLVIDGIFCHGKVFLPPGEIPTNGPEADNQESHPPQVINAFRAEFRDFELGYSNALALDHVAAMSGDLPQAIHSFRQAAETRRHIATRYEAVDKKWSGWRSFRWTGRDRWNRPVLVVELKKLMDSNGSASSIEGAVGWYVQFGLNHLLSSLPRANQQFTMLVDSAGVSALMLPLKMSSLCNYLQPLLANRLSTCFVFNTNFTLRRAWDALCASLRKSVRAKIVYITEGSDFQAVKRTISAAELEVALGGKWKPSAITRTGTSPICMFPSRRTAQLGTDAAIV